MRLRLLFTALFFSLFASPLRSAGAGTGLLGHYFQDVGGLELIHTQLDPQVDFVWPSGTAPVPGVNNSTFMVSWSGQIEALCSDNYVFSTVSDDGVRLFINGSGVIDNWTTHSATVDSSVPIYITAGATVSVVMMFFDDYGDAQASLQWQAAGCIPSAVVIPATQLYPDTQPTPLPSPTSTPLPVWSCPVPDAFNSSVGPMWRIFNINPLGPPGGASIVGGKLQIQGDGQGVLGGPYFGEAATGDSANFLYQTVWGDFDVRLQVWNYGVSTTGQVGLMLRSGVEEGALEFAVTAGPSTFSRSYRTALGAGAQGAGTNYGSFTNGSPQWLRLVRSGNSVQSYFSPNGSAWTPLGTAVTYASLPSDLLLGVTGVSTVPGSLGTGLASNFEVLSAGCTTATPTVTPTFTASPSASDTSTITETPSVTQSFTVSPTFSDSPTLTPSATPTPSWTSSPTDTVTPTASPTPSITETFTASPSFSVSPTITPSPTISPTFTPGPGAPLSHLLVYPNPFSDRLWIGFTLGAAASVEMVAYNVAGEEVYRQSAPERQGTHLRPWDGVNNAGARLASGIYLVRVKADGDAGWLSDWVTVACVR